MYDNFETMKRRITEYFSRVSDDQLQADLEEAGYSFYKNIKTQVLDVFPIEEEFFIAKSMDTIVLDIRISDFEQFYVPDSYNYGYQLAA